jgi:hypothetical protein
LIRSLTLQTSPSFPGKSKKRLGQSLEEACHPPLLDIETTEGDFKTVWTGEIIDEALDKAFVEQKKTLMLLGEYKCVDGLVEHTNEYCAWQQNVTGVFSPGKMNLGVQFAWHSCEKHYGLKK